MATSLFWFYDALVVGILLICLYVGGKRGFLKSVTYLVLTVLSIVFCWLASEVASPIIYEKFLRDQVIEVLTQHASEKTPVDITQEAVTSGDYGVDISEENINTYIDESSESAELADKLANELKENGASLSEYDIKNELEGNMIESMLTSVIGDSVSKETLSELLDSIGSTYENATDLFKVFIKGDITETALHAEETIVSPILKGLLKIIVWLILMLICRMIIGPISDATKIFNKVPLIGPLNHLLGAILGIVEGAILTYCISLAVRLTIYLSDNSLMFLNNQTIANTYAFKYFYDFDIGMFLR